MENKLIIRGLILILILLGVGVTVYKINVLGFSFLPDEKVQVWTVEAEISFTAEGGPVTVSLNAPDNTSNLFVTDAKVVTPNYSLTREISDGVARSVWRTEKAAGEQKLYYRATIYRRGESVSEKPSTTLPASPKAFTGPYLVAAKEVLTLASQERSDAEGVSLKLTELLNAPKPNDNMALLIERQKEEGSTLELLRDLIQMAGHPARIVRGLLLGEKKINKKRAQGMLEISDGSRWLLLNPKTAAFENTDSFLLWGRSNESLLEVEGGIGSKLLLSVVSSKILANKAAIAAGENSKAVLIDFSIYSLPLSEQNTFKLLLLIPFGALVVVILRNLVGIRTSGTFMPILIALSFIQTTLLKGLFLFLVIVGVGLLLRSLLSKLNLLLVPRISAVLVFVIVIYLAISVISFKLGSDLGLAVTFFPMIIISWTIERMSILWEEEGPKEVLIQGGGSLLTASLVYLLMMNRLLEHLTYSFPELLLVVLAVILMIGSYTGYRLSELRRFEPMVKDETP